MSNPISSGDPAAARCYRHPDRNAATGCQRCDRPICPSCMITASVGFQCPECTRSAPQQVRGPLATASRAIPLVLQVAMAISAVAYVAQVATGGTNTGGDVTYWGILFGPSVEAGEWWRIVTSGFLHGGLIHIGFNLYALYLFGQLFRQGPGELPVALIYLGGLFGGAAAVLAFNFNQPTLGASGAVLGLAGGAAIFMRRNGTPFLQSAAGQIIMLNLLLPVLVGGISFWGHLGGAIGGAAVAYAMISMPGDEKARLVAGGSVVGAAAVLSVALAMVGGFAGG